jgi:hypothetical protein
VPSIEIICVGQRDPIDFNDLPFAVESGTELKSHRVPKPLFRKDFAGLKGCIYHLGNPDLKAQRTGRIFFAYDLLSDQSRSASRSRFLEFRPDYINGINDLLASLMDAARTSVAVHQRLAVWTTARLPLTHHHPRSILVDA